MDPEQVEETKHLLKHLQEQTQTAFLADPGLESITIVLSWKTGNTDRPFGLMVGRDGSVSSVSTLVRSSQQTGKMLMYQAAEVNKMFDAADAYASELASKVKQAKEELNEASHSKRTADSPP